MTYPWTSDIVGCTKVSRYFFSFFFLVSAFAGHVPDSFVIHFPNANVSQSPNWGGFKKPFGQVHLLDFNDPLFEQIGNAFIAKQIELFGNVTHYYNCDTFNELKPSSNDTQYLRKAGTSKLNKISCHFSWIFLGICVPPMLSAYMSEKIQRCPMNN